MTSGVLSNALVAALPFRAHLTLLAAFPAVFASVTSLREINRHGFGPTWARLSKGARLFSSPGVLVRITDALTSPEMQPIVRAQPLLMFKYLADYLATGFNERERAAILLAHYSFVRARMEPHFARKIVDGRLNLWQKTIDDQVYRIQLTFPHTTHNEGDLGVIFRANDVDIYTLCFSVGPGSIVGVSAPHVLYVGRVQGKGGGFPLIRAATRACNDISPAQLLLAAAEGIALALGIEHIVGVGAENQISRRQDIARAYDEFWIALGGLGLPRDMYLLSAPLPEKPLQSIKHKNRLRVVRRRAFKRALSEVVFAAFVETVLRPDHRPTPTRFH